MGLNTMILDAIENDTNNPKAKVRINGQWVQFQPIPEHINFLIGNLLEDIDNVILFRLANYFLRFSQEYKRIHPDEKFMDWYEFVVQIHLQSGCKEMDLRAKLRLISEIIFNYILLREKMVNID